MKPIGYLVVILLLAGCKNEGPNLSQYKANVVTARFDVDFFSMDSTNFQASLAKLGERYPLFWPGFKVNLLGIPPGNPDSALAIAAFFRSYLPISAQAAQLANAHLPTLQTNLTKTLRLLQYYVPGWKPDSPFVITSFVGPMDAYESFDLGDYGDVRTSNGVGIALQLHLGAQASVYEQGRATGLYSDYQIRRFTPETMLVNSAKNLIQDIFPIQGNQFSLIEEMIEKGKRLYLLKRIAPDVPDSVQLGYTAAQLAGCEKNEKLIWNYFVQNDLLFSKEPNLNKNYLRDGPSTQEFGEGSPGYIGLFVGRRIIETYMESFPKTTIPQLMELPPLQLFEAAKFKP